MKKELSKEKNINQKNKKVFIITILLISLILISITIITSINKKTYKFDSRIPNIKQEQQKDKQGYKTIAWLKVPGTTIDTPVIGYDNIDTLKNIDKENYLWNNINKEKHYNQINIIGHNILNLSSNPKVGEKYFKNFDDLMSFIYYDFAKENKYIQYTINNKDYIYKIFSVYFEKDYNLDLNHNGNYTKAETKSYINKSKELSIYNYEIDVDENDSLITLSTCTRFFGLENKKQFVVVGRLLRENEKIFNYSVTETKNYKEIKNIMKGVEDNNEI